MRGFAFEKFQPENFFLFFPFLENFFLNKIFFRKDRKNQGGKFFFKILKRRIVKLGTTDKTWKHFFLNLDNSELWGKC